MQRNESRTQSSKTLCPGWPAALLLRQQGLGHAADGHILNVTPHELLAALPSFQVCPPGAKEDVVCLRG